MIRVTANKDGDGFFHAWGPVTCENRKDKDTDSTPSSSPAIVPPPAKKETREEREQREFEVNLSFFEFFLFSEIKDCIYLQYFPTAS